MHFELKSYLPLFKLRISLLITFSAVVSLISTSSGNISIRNALYLIVVTMMASAGASAFNHYFDMDIDSVMERTKNRPIPSGIIHNSKITLLISVLLFLPPSFFPLRPLITW